MLTLTREINLKQFELLMLIILKGGYHFTLVQILFSTDFHHTVQFCRDMLENINEDPQFFNTILCENPIVHEEGCHNTFSKLITGLRLFMVKL